jgi:alkanesulfonate monooxygenase SsuD/methylene tetrahydromethanopterin reductase-like flavin-dependent oxidoreductase (luciferase family)
MEIAVQTMAGYDDTLSLARWCEANGVAALAVADHYLSGPELDSPALDQLVVLGGIARETTTLQLATLVSPLTFRHPAVHLKAAVTLDAMSGGRFSLGIGAGWMEEEHDAFGLELYPMGERFERLEETLAYLTAAVAGTGDGFEGRYYRLAPFDPQPRPQRMRLIVGGVGAKRTPDLAGRYADEFNLAAGDAPWAIRCRRARETAQTFGRTLALSAAFPPIIGSDDADYRTVVEQRAQERGIEPEALEQRIETFDVPSGPPERFVAGLSRLAAAGIERVYLQVGDDVALAIEQTRTIIELAAQLP